MKRNLLLLTFLACISFLFQGCLGVSGEKFKAAFVSPLGNADYDIINPALMTPYGKISADSVRVRHNVKSSVPDEPLAPLKEPGSTISIQVPMTSTNKMELVPVIPQSDQSPKYAPGFEPATQRPVFDGSSGWIAP